jgi:hypothetical protein
MRDSPFYTYTPKPTNLADWRMQRAVKKFVERDLARGQTAPEAVPGSRGFSQKRYHGDHSMQALAGAMIVAFLLLVILPLYAFVWR